MVPEKQRSGNGVNKESRSPRNGRAGKRRKRQKMMEIREALLAPPQSPKLGVGYFHYAFAISIMGMRIVHRGIHEGAKSYSETYPFSTSYQSKLVGKSAITQFKSYVNLNPANLFVKEAIIPS